MLLGGVEHGQVGGVATLLFVALLYWHENGGQRLLAGQGENSAAASIAVCFFDVGVEGLCLAAFNFEVADAPYGAVCP